MADALPETQAVQEALARYLERTLGDEFPTLEVLDDWPEATRLPEFCIAVTVAGEADTELHIPVPITSEVVDGANVVVTYTYGRANNLPLELDCWARTQPARDRLQRALRRALMRPESQTLPGADTGWPTLQRAGYLSLPLPGLFGAVWTYEFKPVPVNDESPEKAAKNEWRAHFRGSASGALLEQDKIAAIKRIHLVGNLGPGPLGGTAGNQQISAVIPKPTP
jgi:hypothetical protein